MRAIEFLTELFDKTVNWSTDSYGDSRFEVNGTEFYVEFTEIRKNELSIVFSDQTNDTIKITGKMKNDTNDAIIVFSTVAKIIVQAISSRKPDYFEFSADWDEPSRVSLYRRLSKKLEQILPYVLEVRGENREETFKFTRKDIIKNETI